jgi:hypothetical protein
MWDDEMDRSQLARMAEVHTPPEPKKWPSGWWIAPASIVAIAVWCGLFEMVKWMIGGAE